MLVNMKRKSTKKVGAPKNPVLNPTYIKIGKRIRQARLAAKFTNSRVLCVEVFSWSAGRINNFETGISTPGPDETVALAEKFGVNPCWITYGVEPMRSTDHYSTRYCNFMRIFEDAEREATLPELLEAVKLTFERLDKIRENPRKKIPDVMARRCEKYLGQHRGWIDE
jgi:transcriptional regulator with XRE-family HTH domain